MSSGSAPPSPRQGTSLPTGEFSGWEVPQGRDTVPCRAQRCRRRLQPCVPPVLLGHGASAIARWVPVTLRRGDPCTTSAMGSLPLVASAGTAVTCPGGGRAARMQNSRARTWTSPCIQQLGLNPWPRVCASSQSLF